MTRHLSTFVLSCALSGSAGLAASALAADTATQNAPAPATAGSAAASVPPPAADTVPPVRIDPPVPPADAVDPMAMQTWTTQMRQRLTRSAAARSEWPAGRHRLVVEFRVSRDGVVSDPALVVASGHRDVDEGALSAVRRMGQLPPFPPNAGVDSQSFRVPLVFDIGDGEGHDGRTPREQRYQDPSRRFTVSAPATLYIQGTRERPGFLHVVGIASHAAGPQPLPGRSRICDMGLRAQREDLRTQDQATLNGADHQAALANYLSRSYAPMGAVALPAGLAFGTTASGREIVVTPKDEPHERRYIAMADTPDYRIIVSCATRDTDVDRALPLFRAIAANLVLRAP